MRSSARWRTRRSATCAALVVSIAGCGGSSPSAEPSTVAADGPGASATTTTTSAPAATSAPTTAAASTERPAPTEAPTSIASTSSSTASPGEFRWDVRPIDDALAARMTPSSWRDGCPVSLSDLRYVSVRYWGFDGAAHDGELVINAATSSDMERAFRLMFDTRFPIQSMRLVDDFGGDDLRSVAANNTSGFNCRYVLGTTKYSRHSFGTAVDINPLVNPYVADGEVIPPAGGEYTDRSLARPGMILADSELVALFDEMGWQWGGRWSDPDWQHFDRTL